MDNASIMRIQMDMHLSCLAFISLQEEQSAHAKTREKLMDAEDKLEFALGEVEILTKQIGREKTQFEKS